MTEVSGWRNPRHLLTAAKRLYNSMPCAGPCTATVRTVVLSLSLRLAHPALPDLLEMVSVFAAPFVATCWARGPPLA